MAITRCPYCHAIIDEKDKYCNNCGTQLLFADDEEVEEEIPGEKIIDAEVEEKDYTVDEPEGEKRPAPAKDLDDEIEEDLDEETEVMRPDELVDGQDEDDEEEAAGKDENATEEVILVDEIEAAGAKKDDTPATPDEDEADAVKTPAAQAAPEADTDDLEGEVEEGEEEDEEEGETLPIELDEEIQNELEEELEPPPSEGAKPEVEYVAESLPPDEASTAGEASLRPVTFDTKELEDLGKTVDLSREKIDKFVEGGAGLGGGPSVYPPAAPVPPRPEPEPQPEPDLEPEGSEPEAPAEAAPKTPPEPPTASLPPWASTMKGAPVFQEDTGPVETRKLRGGEPAASDTGDEVEIFPRRRAPDSTMGLPEEVSQAPLPFEAPASAEDETGDLELAEEEEGEGEAEVGREDTAAQAAFREARDLTPEEAVMPAGRVRQAREPFLPARPQDAVAPARPAVEAAEEAEEPEPRPPFSFSVFFRSKAFDILFVGVFWVAALWLAAGSMGRTLFEILGSMSGPMLLLYAVFLFLYFFLFKFFLGETIGDRLFRRRE